MSAHVTTRTYGADRMDIVAVTVRGNVPKRFQDGLLTEMTFSREQAFLLYQDLKEVFADYEAARVPARAENQDEDQDSGSP